MVTTLPHYPSMLESLKADPRISAAGLRDEIPGVQPSREDVLKRTRAAGIDDELAGDPKYADKLAGLKALLATYCKDLPHAFGEFKS